MNQILHSFALIIVFGIPTSVIIIAIVNLLEDMGSLNIFKKKYRYVSHSGCEYKVYLKKDGSVAVIKGNGARRLIGSPDEGKVTRCIEEVESLSTALDSFTVNLEKRSRGS